MIHLTTRTTRLVLVFFLATFASYCLLNLIPGDIIDVLLGETAGGTGRCPGNDGTEFGLDQPIIIRYFNWLGAALTGDFGRSAFSSQPVLEAIFHRLPATLELVLLSQILAISLAIPLGVLSAARPDSKLDRMVTFGSFVVLSLPTFVIGVILLFVFSVSLHWLPASGHVPFFEDPLRNLRAYILPATAVAVLEGAVLVRVLRSDMISVLQEEYIALARAKGLGATRILFTHALRPASLNIVTIIGLQIGNVISASVIVETLFSIPGVGSLLIQSVRAQDTEMVQGVVTTMVILSVLASLMVDLVYTLLDPRIGNRK